MRCGFIKRGMMPAFASDDLPEPLAPETSKKARPPRALAASSSVAFITAASRPKKIGACSNSYGSRPRNGSPSQIGSPDVLYAQAT